MTHDNLIIQEPWPLDGEPIKTDDDWCFDCDMQLDLCECED